MEPAKNSILLIEDDAEDVLLFKDHLTDSDIQANVYDTDNKEGVLKVLNSRKIDLILCDNTLPDMDALEGLELVKQHQPQIPFIVLSGTITNDLAVKALQLGASDILNKGDYYRLIPAVKKELKINELKNSKRSIEKQIAKKNATLHFLAEQIDDAVGLVSTEGRIIYISPAIEKITGIPQKEFFGKKVYNFIDEKDTEKIRASIKEDLKKNLIRTYKVNIKIKRGGEDILLEARIKSISDNSQVSRFALLVKDNTTLIKSQENLHKSHEKFSALSNDLKRVIEDAKSPFFEVDREWNITEWNPCCEEITGYSKEDAIGKSFLQTFIKPEHHLYIINNLRGPVLSGKAINAQLPVTTIHGEEKTWLVNSTPRMNLKGETIGVLTNGQDITELIEYRTSLEKIIEERTSQLKKAMESEKAMANLKLKFVSMASHEFRTPLSIIKLAANFVKRYYERASKEQIYQRVQKIDEQIDNMIYLLDDVLSFGKSEEHKINAQPAPIPLNEFIEATKSDIEEQFNSHSIEVENHISSKYITTDKSLLKTISSNLLSNAIKYSPEHLTIFWTFEEITGGILMTIEDNGIGIPEKDQQTLFEPFYRAQNTEGISGTGLGLSIVKRAVETLNGSISFESHIGKGTKFIVYLPVNGSENNSAG